MMSAHHGFMTAAVDTAVAAFRETLLAGGALDGVAASDAVEVGRRAALLVQSATAWQEHLGELLDVKGVMRLLGVSTRQAVYDLVARHRLLGLRRDGGSMAFPTFQFDPATGRAYRVIGEVLTAFATSGVDAYTVATWLASEQDELDGATPVSQLSDLAAADAIVAAATRTATRLSH